ncbi:hypothetical protein F6X38_15635 [Aureimonas leprariae]|uniref:Uncharacterized protein n=1 Tax=Plantimonas leprariae TaxID=2615207 RepID=A0A7V7TVH0_9HYPH|nr:hypothetical protein F6X38_15635 [Aureimonas leprariae]
MSSFGLTFLSRAALRQAERAMLGGSAGVRDEVGFLLVHQRYADRFFPGTSVLHRGPDPTPFDTPIIEM